MAYQTRRYGCPNPSASWYGDLLREAGSVFEVHDNPEEALQRFMPVANSPPNISLPRNATFSELCIAAGIKKAKTPPWEQAKAAQQDSGMKNLNDTIHKLFEMPS
jgi:hypothetical protein